MYVLVDYTCVLTQIKSTVILDCLIIILLFITLHRLSKTY